jgi:branched-chain amino acid transport system ATP-binding protein
MDNFMEIRGLVVRYGPVNALTGVSLDVQKGKIVSVIGANGAGKSSLLNAISGLVKPRSGTIRFKGESLLMPPHRIVRRGVAQVPEGRRIYPGLTVDENLIMGAARGTRDMADIKERVLCLFPILRERRRQHGGTLSGGEQQMLAIARAMMSRPELIMFDEPSMGLAPVIVKEVFKYIREINAGGTTVLLIEQNAKLALSTSDYTYVLENGGIKFHGPSAEMMENTEIKKAYLGE